MIHKSRVFSLIIIFAIVSFANTVSASATNMFGLKTSLLPEEEKNNFLANVDLELLHDDSRKNKIACFDVSEDGLIAIGAETGTKRIVYLYDQNGVFQYGYRFHSSGDYGIIIQEDTLAIYFGKSDIVAIFDSTGRCMSAQEVLYPGEYKEEISEICYRTQKEVSGKTYSLERDVNGGGRSYARLVAEDEQGTKTILYDVTTLHSAGTIVMYVLIIGFFSIIILGFIFKVHNYYKSKGNKTRRTGDGSAS